jgi:hypothetical protein
VKIKITMEPERKESYEQITRLHISAFNRDGEAKLV